MSLEIQKLTHADPELLTTLTGWMYDWWGKRAGHSLEAVRCYMEHSLSESRLPQTWGAFADGKIVGMYQFTYSDLFARPDIYPWLANVYIDPAYRSMGYGRQMLESVRRAAQESLSVPEIFLYTNHTGLYEKFGWEYVGPLDTFQESSRIERLYRLSLKQEAST